MLKKIFSWLAVIVWMAVIYYFSAQPDLKSSLEPFWDLFFRKVAHTAEYFVLAYLLFRAYQSHSLSVKRSLLFAFIVSLVYAATDEWHQGIVAGRVASPVDAGIDGIGALLFVTLRWLQKDNN